MSTKKEGREVVSSLYVLKALCAFGVIILHVPLVEWGDAMQLWASMTVPVFFMITGYFLFSKDDAKLQERLLASMRKVALITAVLHLIFSPIVIATGSLEGAGWVVYAKWLFMGQMPGFGHLWYMTALLLALITLWGWVKCFGSKLLSFFPALVVIWLVQGGYRELLTGVQESMMTCNFVTYALPCLTTGFVIRKYEDKILRVRWLIPTLAIFVGAYINSFVLDAFISPLYLKPLFRIALGLTAFFLALQYKSIGKGSALEYIGRELSGNIYYFHALSIWLLALFLPKTSDVWRGFLPNVPLYELCMLGAITILTLLIAWVVVRLQRALGVRILQ